MKFSSLACCMFMLKATSQAFITPYPARLRPKLSIKASNNPYSEFDHLLGEGNEYVQNAIITSQRVVNTGDSGDAVVQLVSSSAGVSQLDGFPAPKSERGGQEIAEEIDPYSESAALASFQQKIEQQENKGFTGFLQQLTFQELVVVFIIPSIATFAAGRWGFNRLMERLEVNVGDKLDNYASEMIYHDGDFEEMKLCTNSYRRRLVILGPKKKDIMLKHYLEAYAKKKVVSPQSISSLSSVFTMYKLSEEKAAETLVSLCQKMGTEKTSSAGKLYFFGTHILKSPEGKAKLRPIKEMLMATYRDQSNAEQFVDTAQKAMAEAAYRTAIQAGGKNQDSLTVGWQVLGLDEETATRIFEDEKEEGFVSAREAMYGSQSQKYDAKGRAIDDDGKLKNPEDADKDDDEGGGDGGDGPTEGVFECGQCGYTMFVAKGREHKFFADDFKCPECGAPKDQFVTRNIDEDDD